MPRPSEPLLSKRRVAELAVEIVDADGLNGLNLRKLADRAGVHVMSLYHHFPNKDAIVAAAANLALEDVGHAWDGTIEWRQAFFDLAHRLRDALRKHPELIPVIARRRSLHVGDAEDEAAFRLLAAQGVPESMAPTLFELIESYVVGHVMLSGPPADRGDPPSRSQALDRAMSSADAFDFAIRRLIDGFADLVAVAPAGARRAGDTA
jgi:AcrR family transcriptional regulator